MLLPLCHTYYLVTVLCSAEPQYTHGLCFQSSCLELKNLSHNLTDWSDECKGFRSHHLGSASNIWGNAHSCQSSSKRTRSALMPGNLSRVTSGWFLLISPSCPLLYWGQLFKLLLVVICVWQLIGRLCTAYVWWQLYLAFCTWLTRWLWRVHIPLYCNVDHQQQNESLGY